MGPTKSALRWVVLVVPFLLASCAHGGLLAGGRTITAAEIRQSGAHDAWEVLEQSGTQITIPAQARDRTAASYLAEIPRVLVDGVQMIELRLLRDIPATIISRVRIIPGLGGGSGDDVILIETRQRR